MTRAVCMNPDARYRDAIRQRLRDMAVKPPSQADLQKRLRLFESSLTPEQRDGFHDSLKGVRQTTTKEYIAHRFQLKKQYHEAIVFLKLTLVIGLVVLALYARYTGFIRRYPGKFSLEMLAFVISTVFSYTFFVCYRNARMTWKEFLTNLGYVIFFTILVVLCAELGSIETKLSATIPVGNVPPSPYRKDLATAQEKLASRIIYSMVSVFVLFLLIGLFMAFRDYRKTDASSRTLRGMWSTSFSLRVVLWLVGFAILFIALSLSTEAFSNLKESIVERTGEDVSRVPDWVFSLGVLVALAYVAAFLYVLYVSVFKIHSINLFSYAADRPSVWNGRGRGASNNVRIFFFLIEAFVVTLATAAPLFMVAYFRNPAEKRRIFRDRAVMAEFFLLCVKVFLFYTMLQLVGAFDWTNRGYCIDENFHNTVDPSYTTAPPFRTLSKSLIQGKKKDASRIKSKKGESSE